MIMKNKQKIRKRSCLLWFPIQLKSYTLKKVYDDWELIFVKGLISKHEEKIKIYKINDITYHRSFRDFFFGVGNLTIESSDESCDGKLEIVRIHGYKRFGKTIEQLTHEERKRVNIKYNETSIINKG